MVSDSLKRAQSFQSSSIDKQKTRVEEDEDEIEAQELYVNHQYLEWKTMESSLKNPSIIAGSNSGREKQTRFLEGDQDFVIKGTIRKSTLKDTHLVFSQAQEKDAEEDEQEQQVHIKKTSSLKLDFEEYIAEVELNKESVDEDEDDSESQDNIESFTCKESQSIFEF